jgi:phage terminase large subunit-like protein
MAPHFKVINDLLVSATLQGEEPIRLMVNVPYQHGKTTLTSYYFPAWYLLNYPHRRIIFVACGDDLAGAAGSRVRSIIDRWGPKVGIKLRADTRAKAEWLIDDHDGGMVCRGVHSAVVGRPADLFLIDDLIRNAVEAMSPTTLERHWDFYNTVVLGRLQRETGLIVIGTRWSKQDIFGRILANARKTREKWTHVKFKAIAEKDDPLGRPIGTPLWPEKVSLQHLLNVQKTSGKWFRAAWQQEPEDEEGSHLKPRSWPRYKDLGDAWSCARMEKDGGGRDIFIKDECGILTTMDWAWSEKATSDCSAIATWALTPTGKLLLLDVVAARIALHDLAPALATVCRRYRPHMVAIETGHPTLRDDCQRFPEIPQPRWLTPNNRGKLVRALPAIVMGENGLILLPDAGADWLEGYFEQVGDFSGWDDRDDLIDVTAYAAQLAQELKGSLRRMRPGVQEAWPELLIPGHEVW